MEMSGEYMIVAPRERIYDALNDPDVLRQCIPGCESIEKLSDNEMEATVVAKVGPVRAKFKGQVTLSDLVYPESYTITGEGRGGSAGFARGGVRVRLQENGAGTTMSYEVKAEIGGKLAQLGSRLIDSTAKKMANDFFERLRDLVADEAPQADVSPAAASPAAQEASRAFSPMIWLIGLGVVALAAIYLFTQG